MAVSVGDGVWEGVGSGKVGMGVGVRVAVGDAGIGDGIMVSVGVGTAEMMVLSFVATDLSELSVSLSHEVNVELNTSRRMRIILLVVISWVSSFCV